MVDGEPAVWYRSLFNLPEHYDGSIRSFRHTEDEATSVIPLGEDYSLTHHWHPTPVSEKVYQLDVTVQPTGAYQPQPIMYRRMIPFEVDGWNLETVPDYVTLSRGSGDGISDATSTLLWEYGPDPWPGTIDDPRVPLPHHAFSELIELYPSITRGIAIDRPISSGSRTDPNAPDFTMYYGIADSAAQAQALLNSLHATTTAVASIPAEGGDHTVFIGYRDTP